MKEVYMVIGVFLLLGLAIFEHYKITKKIVKKIKQSNDSDVLFDNQDGSDLIG